MDKDIFQEAADSLPEWISWGDPITPEIVAHIRRSIDEPVRTATSDADLNVLMRLERLIGSWEYFGTGKTVAQVNDSHDSHVALSIDDMAALLRLAKG